MIQQLSAKLCLVWMSNGNAHLRIQRIKFKVKDSNRANSIQDRLGSSTKYAGPKQIMQRRKIPSHRELVRQEISVDAAYIHYF
jgi:hypothetical protein